LFHHFDILKNSRLSLLKSLSEKILVNLAN